MPPAFTFSVGKDSDSRVLESAARFYLKRLFAKSRAKIPISVNIEFVSGLQMGDITANHSDYPREYAEFTIRLDSDLTLMGKLAVLAHECVHLWQYRMRRKQESEDISEWEAVYIGEYVLLTEFANSGITDSKRWYQDPYYSNDRANSKPA